MSAKRTDAKVADKGSDAKGSDKGAGKGSGDDPADKPAGRTPATAEAEADGSQTKVLLAEDDESFIDALVIGLSREGFEVTVARDGNEALRLFEDVDPDLVLLDLMLPRLSGIDVCRSIRARSSVPIIMVTAKGTEIDTVVGLEVGADDYVAKPYRLPRAGGPHACRPAPHPGRRRARPRRGCRPRPRSAGRCGAAPGRAGRGRDSAARLPRQRPRGGRDPDRPRPAPGVHPRARTSTCVARSSSSSRC